MTSTSDAALITGLRKAITQYAKAKLRCGAAGYVWDADAVLHAEEHCDKALQVVNDALAQAAARIEALSKAEGERDEARNEVQTIRNDVANEYRAENEALRTSAKRALAERDALRAQLDAMGRRVEEAERDTARLNWLENMTVNVRVPLVYGSRDLFWATPGEEKGEISDLRAKVDKHAAFQKDTTHGPL